MLPLLLGCLLLAHSAAPAAAAPSFVKPLFANTSSSLANKTAALLASANAKERNIITSLGSKPNSTILAATLAAYKNLTSGNAVTIVAPSVALASSPTGTLQCLVNADGIVAGLVGANGNSVCAASADTVVSIPVNDGYISGFKVAVAKRGPPYVGQLVIDVTPRGGGAPSTYSCGSGGGVPATLLSSKQSLALTNLQLGCVPAPQAAGRRKLATSATVMDVNSIKIEVATPPAAVDAAVPTLQLNSVPVAGSPPPPPPPPTVTASNATLAAIATTLVISGTGFDPTGTNTVTLSSGTATVVSATATSLTLAISGPLTAGPLSAVVTSFGQTSGAPVLVARVVVYGYVTSYNAGTVIACEVAAGVFSNCAVAASGFNGPTGVTISNGRAYVSNTNTVTMSVCEVAGPLLRNCATASSAFNGPYTMAVSGNAAFVTNFNGNTVSGCTVSGQNLINCALTASSFSFIYPTTVITSGNTAYITSRNTNSVAACDIAGTTLVNCRSANPTFAISSPNGIALANGYAFIVNRNVNTVTSCLLTGTTLSGCSTTGNNFNTPSEIVIYGGYAYVTNRSGNNVVSCLVSGQTLWPCSTATSVSQAIGIAIAG